MTTYVFKAELEEEEDGRWSAWIDALPGCGAWGYTREEALEALHDMTQVFVETMLDLGKEIPLDKTHSSASPTVTVTLPVTIA